MDSLVIFGAKYLFIFIILLYGLAVYQAGRKDKKALLLALVIAGVIAVILDKIGGQLYYDPRPFTHGITPLITHSADNGFPSEHTVFSVTLATVLVFFRPRLGAAALVLALAVGVSRVAAHVHSPIDIIGGIAIGMAAGAGGYYLAKRIVYKRSSN